ncbi:Protein of unknown function [Actinopolyspora mzabensis]|uniref:DUF3558 domain-containing protein n=1 Tax=Actinopolyspora mzabensis TaxID=995066 RepID=A0A1G8XZA7_ACTMZ|nr:DUF3558 domain-containing protein [Actinopolyspora mzabensis]SDJ95843.1 Protein of unknown function [Actinopolyspora mzabensis]
MRNTVTTGISLAAGLLLLAGCSGGQTGQAAQETTDTGTSAPTSTSGGAGVSLPERTAPAKSLDIADPCTVITKQQALKLGTDRTPYPRTSEGQQGCSYQKGKAGSNSGWRVFVAPDFERTISEAIETHPGGEKTEINNYPAYAANISGIGCYIAVDVAEDGFLLVNGQVRPGENRPDPCPIFTKFAEAAIKNLPEA